MTLSEQIDALQAKVSDLKSSLDASRHETNEQIKARVASAQAQAKAAEETVHGRADQAADHAHTQWQSFKADVRPRCRSCRDVSTANAKSTM
jgi:peptidoglycan hydrolase CwlO-like protein